MSPSESQSRSRLEWVISPPTWHHEIEPWFNAETVSGCLPDKAFKDELLHLWHFANACEGRRGKPRPVQGINDYNFAIRRRPADPDPCRVEITDASVAALGQIGRRIDDRCQLDLGQPARREKIACLYLRPRARCHDHLAVAHEGLGLLQYAWMTSPRAATVAIWSINGS